jgi:Tfp pilus assembly protein PilV
VAENGFTLVEVMIAILLTVIAVVGIMALYMTETKASSFSRHSTEATALAQDKLEKLRYAATPTGSSETGLDAVGKTGGIFERGWTVTAVGTSYYDIIVYVGWDEDEAAGATCTQHSACSSGYCRISNSKCAGRAVIVRGRLNQ